ncbi:hypothetical protein D9M70_354480 [compost metagenome]
MGLGQGLGFLGDETGVAEVRRQVTQVAGEGHAVGDGLGVQAAALDLGLVGLVHQQGDFLQGLGLGLLALETIELVGAVGQGLHHQAGFPIGVAAFDRQLAQGQEGIATAEVLQHAAHGGDRFAELAVRELALLAAAHQQHALGLEVGEAVQEQGLADLAGQVATLEQGGNGAAGGVVDGLGGFAEFAPFADRDDQGGGFQGFQTGAFDEEFHDMCPQDKEPGLTDNAGYFFSGPSSRRAGHKAASLSVAARA